MDWISIEERKPAIGDVVLVKCEEMEYAVSARRMKAGFVEYGTEGNGEEVRKNITEWAECPLAN